MAGHRACELRQHLQPGGSGHRRGVAKAGELILKSARREVHLRVCSPSRALAEIKVATLGPKSGVLGAAALARDPSSGEYVLRM